MFLLLFTVASSALLLFTVASSAVLLFTVASSAQTHHIERRIWAGSDGHWLLEDKWGFGGRKL